jgi:Trm5-related predicted tRNA methylase
MIADHNDPEQRKERHQLRRQQNRNKLEKEIKGMNSEEIKLFLAGKKKAKLEQRDRTAMGLQLGTPILVDAVFEAKMNEKENKSLAIQIELIMKAIKHVENPPGIHLCSVGGKFKTQLEKMGYQHWILTSTADDVVEVAKKLNKQPVYLSPDAQEEIT